MKIGDTFNQSFTIGLDIYEGFINLFKDKNPMHINAGFAVKHGYREVVVHGNILNGFISYFIGECLPIKNVVILSQEIKYSHPLYLHDTITLHAEIVHVFKSVNVIEFSFYFMGPDKK